MQILATIGAMLGIAGALLLAVRFKWSAYGWLAFLLSNAFWITYGLQQAEYELVIQQIVFTMTSLLGIYRWLVPTWRSMAND